MFQIRFNHVTKQYRYFNTTQTVLDDVTFDIHENELVLLKGPSGSGKSTVLNLMMGFESPDRGNILIRREKTGPIIDITNVQDNVLLNMRRKFFGIVFQFFNLDPLLSVYENIELPILLNKSINQNNRVKSVIELLKKFDIEKLMNHAPNELSNGEKQRVALCRAMINDPSVIIADEPTGNLDAGTKESIISLLRNLSFSGKTIIIATHDNDLINKNYKELLFEDGNLTISQK
ncbi:MAG: ABC transporter ATP-binding protein [Candidatus Hodarchaeales archaeon]